MTRWDKDWPEFDYARPPARPHVDWFVVWAYLGVAVATFLVWTLIIILVWRAV